MRSEISADAPLMKLLAGARTKHVPSGQIIFYADDMPLEVYIVKNGVVKVYDIDDEGNEKILHLVKPPALIPFAFFSGMHNPLRWFIRRLPTVMYVYCQLPNSSKRHIQIPI